MYRWQARAEIGVSFVRANYQAPRIGQGEVDPRNARIGREELGPQMLPGRFGQIFGIACSLVRAKVLVKAGSDFFLLDVNRGEDDVAGGLAAQLNDPLPQIGIDNLNSMSL